ncbi:uncharacterized protein LOC106780210 [Vigna radiata var. radiata]|uniref:Uncharacterized protein LOC106780210 n=1 Tax=Vigna radiata var. radiata TaxID=3916 RepID=A0A1S3W051_VIGRR|nr:uncharacterized protein LOC106780210 [Vigna radiata var. radiata]
MIGWSVELSEFGLQYEPRGSVKVQHLAEFAIELPYPMPKQVWKLYVDGSAGKAGGGAGIVLEGSNGVIVEQFVVFKFKVSNNQAEYEALIVGMELAWDIEVDILECRTDSQIVEGHMNGSYQNTRADRLSKLADGKEKGVLNSVIRQVLSEPSIECHTISTPCNPNDQNCWKEEIIRLIRKQEAGHNLQAEETKKISRYCLIGDDLYRRGYVTPIMKCLSTEEATYVLQELHHGICGRHTGGRALKARVLRAGFFWPTLEQDYISFSQKCVSCQKHGNVFHAPASELHNIFAPWPFAQWGMDIVGPFPTNGQAEAANKIIVNELKKRLGEALGGWVDEIDQVLWGYRCSPHGSTGESPFNLTCGTYAMLPVEVGEPTMRRKLSDMMINDEQLRSNLDVIDERRHIAAIKNEAYKRLVPRRYNTKVISIG